MSNLTEIQNQTLEAECLTEEVQIEKKNGKKILAISLAAAAAIALISGILAGFLLSRPEQIPEEPVSALTTEPTTIDYNLPDWMTAAFLTVDGESRTGEKLEAVRDLAVHYVANPGTSAMANRNYFEGPDSGTGAHFIVGLEGEVLALIPTDEKSCATNERNVDTISIEVCHPDETGKFSEATYESLIRLLAYLCNEFDLTEENLIRHYDVTGKLCPRYYVENPEAWETLKADVAEALAKGIFDDEKA